MIQEWKDTKNAIHARAPKEALNNPAWEWAVVVPRADKATEVAANIIHDGRAACVLMPTDVVHYTSQRKDRSIDQTVVQAIQKAGKVQIMASTSTWLLFNMDYEQHHILAMEPAKVQAPGPVNGWTEEVGHLSDWISEQKDSLKTEKALKGQVTREDGLVLFIGANDIARIYVPRSRRKALFEYHHTSLGHLAAVKTHTAIHRNYWWPGMRSDVRRWYDSCPFCELSKAKRNAAHGTFRAVEGGPPRSRWVMDFYGVESGNILGLIGLDSL